MVKKVLSGVLCITLACIVFSETVAIAANKTGASINNFKAVTAFGAGTFTDVGTGAWYYSYIREAYELGIMNGKGGGLFEPDGNIRVCEAIKMACVVHNIYNGGTAAFAQDAQPWYQTYVQYAINNGILAQNYFYNYDAYATRENMAMLFSRALPQSELAAINTIGVLPDVDQDSSSLQGVYTLYRAGVLCGNDSYGTFEAGSYINRAQAAAIITRLAVPSERKHFTLKTVEMTNAKMQRLTTLKGWHDTAVRLHDVFNTVYLGDAATAYFYDNGLVLLEEYATYDPNLDDYIAGSYDSSWYCMSGKVYCIVMNDPKTGESLYTLYFDAGQLIAWTDSDGNSYYNGYRWDEMQSYYAHAEAQCSELASRY